MKSLPFKMKRTKGLKSHQAFKIAEFILKERKITHQIRIFFIKQISNPCQDQLLWHGKGQPNRFLLTDVERKWMHNIYKQYTNNIYTKNFYLLFNTFVYIKTEFLSNAPSHCPNFIKIFYKMHSIHVLSKYMNDPPPHLVAIPSIFYLE